LRGGDGTLESGLKNRTALAPGAIGGSGKAIVTGSVVRVDGALVGSV
jgi:hypothetical protein